MTIMPLVSWELMLVVLYDINFMWLMDVSWVAESFSLTPTDLLSTKAENSLWAYLFYNFYDPLKYGFSKFTVDCIQ